MKNCTKKGSVLVVVLALLLQMAAGCNYAQAAKKVAFSSKKISVTAGSKKKISLKNSKKKVSWSVISGKKVVKLSSKKKTSVVIVGKKKGTARVQAKVGKKKYVCKVTVKAKKVTSAGNPTKAPSATVAPGAAASAAPTQSAGPSITPTNQPAPTAQPAQTPEPTRAPSATLAPMVEKNADVVAKEMGVGLNLGNTMEAYSSTNCEKVTYTWIPKVGSNTPSDYETCWGAPVTTQEMIDGMKAAGFSTVRIPVFWGNMMENDGTYTINPNYINRVKEIVNYCQNDGLYAVINIHHFDEFIIRRHTTKECAEIFNHLWTQIADAFKDYPETLVFEGFNEYLGGSQFNASGNLVDQSDASAYQMANTLNQSFVDAVRSTGGNNEKRVLVVSGYWTNIDKTTSDQFVIPKDMVSDKLMVSVHYVDNQMYWENKVGGQEWMDYTIAQCELLKNAFTAKGIPVFLGETTSRYGSRNIVSGAEYNTSSDCLQYILTTLKSYGFVPVLWDTSNNFYSRTTCTIKSATDSAVIANY